MNPPRDDSQRESVHDIVRRETDKAFATVRTDIENLERLHASMLEKTSETNTDVALVNQALERLKADLEKLETKIKTLSDAVADLPLIRKIVYYPFGLVVTAVILWALSKIGLGSSK
jgi:chromosome segregation ATPase